MDRAPLSDYQNAVYMQGLMGVRPDFPFSMEALEALAREAMEPRAFWYVAGGAGADETVRTNREAFMQWRIVPRMMRDVSARHHETKLFGDTLAAPLMLAPVGVQEIVHPEAERAVARAAASVKVPVILSTLSSTRLEEVAELLGDTPRWFQLYPPKDAALMRSLVKRAEDAGYSAIVVTVDTRMMGWREHDLEHAFLPFIEGKGIVNYTSDPVFRAQLAVPPEEDPRAAIARWVEVYSDLSQTAEYLRLVREATSLPILVKGILHPEDALNAVEMGAQGIIVSNHGGRQSGGTIAAIDALPDVVDAVGPEVPVIMDSGIRTGADMIKALALGARAVLLGRPYIYGLAARGEEGVRTVLQRMLADYDITMAACGFVSPAQLDRTVIRRAG